MGVSAKASEMTSTTDDALASDMFLPPLETVAARPLTTESRTSPSSVETRLVSSVMRGSTLGWCCIRTPRAAAPRFRTDNDEGSTRDLTKVRWSCGKKGLTKRGTRWRRMVRVERMADLTGGGKRSPMTRTVGEEESGRERLKGRKQRRTEGTDGLYAVRLECFWRCSLDEVTKTVSGLLALLGGTSEKTLEEDGWRWKQN